MRYSFLVIIGLLLCAHVARADCPAGAPDFANGVCQAQNFAATDATLTQLTQQLTATLPPAAQAAFQHEQQLWSRQRGKACTTHGGGQVFINFGYAARLTQARVTALKSRMSAPSVTLIYKGHYTVPGTAMPWEWQAGGLNSAYKFGQQDGSGPTVLTLAGLGAAPGQMLIFRYVSGQTSAIGATKVAGEVLPTKYVTSAPVAPGALVAAFTDTTGQLVGAPFAPGNGPVQVQVPQGATQLQLGFNDAAFAGNTGSVIMAVTVAPAQKISGAATGLHGCAIFGANLGSACQNYPNWTSGLWLPPPGSGALHVLVAGGGGGGSSTLATGTGGAGGGSGMVIDSTLPIPDAPLNVQLGSPGGGAQRFNQPGGAGAASVFGNITAGGGNGGQARAGGSGNNGGGGGGGGTYQTGFDAGAGGMGASGGAPGQAGLPAMDTEDGTDGTNGGAGAPFPAFDYSRLTISAGAGGQGGAFGAGGTDATGNACEGGGGGGGGGGGILLNNAGVNAQGANNLPAKTLCGQAGVSGLGGTGFGAGGGGAGAGRTGTGGNGAPGVVFVEW
jgi:uncharacterized protein YecT (DUF1311 family)